MNADRSGTNGVTKPAKTFTMPSRQEAEERRKQIEANSKPALLFKPKGIVDNNSQSPKNATNSKAPVDDDASSISRAGSHVGGININDTRMTVVSSGVQHSRAVSVANPVIVSSQQHYHQQQQQQQQKQPPKQHHPVSSEDEFGFGDDLGDVVLDDDFFHFEDLGSKEQKPTAAETQSTTATTTSSASTATISAKDPATALVTPPPFVPKSKTTIVVKSSQRGNPLLQFIRNVPYEYGDIVPDFVVGLTSCILFLSIRYHRLHPEYIFSRIAALGKTFVLRILLVLVDVDTHQRDIRELTRVAMVNEFTIVCAWSNEEAARYIETYKAYENKAPDAIKERIENDYLSKITDCLTQIQSVNKTDVVTLSSIFGSFKNIMSASVDELGVLPGFGERKVKRLMEAFDQPFAIDPKKRRQRRG
ncbi:ssDNA endonuclease and repair protein rad10 [Dissophora ornata]|nr:ssDNA endonuclease and repair protein rad10 [Dissophora ornata]